MQSLIDQLCDGNTATPALTPYRYRDWETRTGTSEGAGS